MTKNFYKLWMLMLLVTGGIALWFSGGAAKGIWKFVHLDTRAPATVSKLEILDLSSSRFAIGAEYHFEVKGVGYSGKTIFDSPQFLNRYAAENYVKVIEGKRWQTWYREKSPSYSSLEKEFPQKQCLQALITVGVFAYFYFARSMLAKVMG